MSITFNANTEQKIKRNVERISTLKIAIEQTDNKERKDSLNKELERRQGEIKAIQDLINQS